MSPVIREGKDDTSGCEWEYHSAQKNIQTSGGRLTDSDASGQEGNTCDNGYENVC